MVVLKGDYICDVCQNSKEIIVAIPKHGSPYHIAVCEECLDNAKKLCKDSGEVDNDLNKVE